MTGVFRHGRSISIRDIDPSKLGPNSPLLELLRRKPRHDHEHEMQAELFQWIFDNEARHPEFRWIFAVPNWIGVRTAKQGARLKAEAGKNHPTKEQKEWLTHLREEGWSVHVVWSAEVAKLILLDYLAGKRLNSWVA